MKIFIQILLFLCRNLRIANIISMVLVPNHIVQVIMEPSQADLDSHLIFKASSTAHFFTPRCIYIHQQYLEQQKMILCGLH